LRLCAKFSSTSKKVSRKAAKAEEKKLRRAGLFTEPPAALCFEYIMPTPYGFVPPPKPRASRLSSYLRALGWGIAGAATILGTLAIVQVYFHPFDIVLDRADASLAAMDRVLTQDEVAGVSMGSLALVLAVAALPLFRKGVRRRQYAVSFWRGLLSSVIFLATDKLYRYVQGLGVLYFSATLALFLAVTIVLVEIISRAGKAEDEEDTRTELIASIVSGLVFGLLVQLGEHLLRFIGR